MRPVTVPIIDVDLDLAVEDHKEDACEYSYSCTRVATAYVITDDSCKHIGNPLPVCELCLHAINDYIASYGRTDWSCNVCFHVTSIIEIRRK